MSFTDIKPIDIGDVYMFCRLGWEHLCCEKHQVISIKPFRLQQLGGTDGEWSPISLPEQIFLTWQFPVTIA
jgi:hypothetical protein